MAELYNDSFQSIYNLNLYKKKLVESRDSFKYIFLNIQHLIADMIANVNSYDMSLNNSNYYKLLLAFLNERRKDAAQCNNVMHTILQNKNITCFGLMKGMNYILNNFKSDINPEFSWNQLLSNNLTFIKMQSKGNPLAVLLNSDPDFKEVYDTTKFDNKSDNKYALKSNKRNHKSNNNNSSVYSSNNINNNNNDKMHKFLRALNDNWSVVEQLCNKISIDFKLVKPYSCAFFNGNKDMCFNPNCVKKDGHFCVACFIKDNIKVTSHGFLSCPKYNK